MTFKNTELLWGIKVTPYSSRREYIKYIRLLEDCWMDVETNELFDSFPEISDEDFYIAMPIGFYPDTEIRSVSIKSTSGEYELLWHDDTLHLRTNNCQYTSDEYDYTFFSRLPKMLYYSISVSFENIQGLFPDVAYRDFRKVMLPKWTGWWRNNIKRLEKEGRLVYG